MTPLRIFTVFHLNLMFSSIGEDRRAEVVERCYRPLVALADDLGLPIGIEASGLTLDLIRQLDPELLQRLRKLVEAGRCEFVGSGHAQLIGPLVPASVNRANLRLGQDRAEALLGVRPRLGFVNEQAFAAGLVPAFLEADFRGLVMEWNNPARHHPTWPKAWRFRSLAAAGPDGERLPLLWNDSVSFQKVQRVGHGLLPEDELVDWWASFAGEGRQLCVYGGDAEVFDFRPKRFAAEPGLAAETGEWERVRQLFERVARDERFRWVRPSELLAEGPGVPLLELGSAAEPCPVKKQPKYNLTRWATSGRDDVGVNAACHRIADALGRSDADDRDWQELCRLWSSDFRTHITEPRWRDFRRDLRALETRLGTGPATTGRPAVTTNAIPAYGVEESGARLRIASDELDVVFGTDRGLTLDAVRWSRVDERPLIGRLPHGRFDDVAWAADYYTGHLVFQPPGGAQVTDLAPVAPRIDEGARGPVVSARIDTPLGAIDKRWELDLEAASLTLEIRLGWPEPVKGILRTGFVTLLPEAFDRGRLFYASQNGGAPERFAIDAFGAGFDHGAVIGPAVTASTAVGMTGGWLELGDDERVVRVENDHRAAALVGLVRVQPFDDDVFVRAALSAGEVDETAHAVRREGLLCRVRLSARRASLRPR